MADEQPNTPTNAPAGGFNVPPAPGAAVSPSGSTAGAGSAPQGGAAPVDGGPDLTAAIAALTAALQPPAAATGDVPAQLQSPGAVEPPADLNNIDIEGLQDPLLQSMAYALGAGAPANFDANRALGLAIERGDPSLVDKAYLIEKFGKDAAQRIRIAEGIVQQVQERSKAAAESAYAEAGGKEQWAVAASVFNSQAPSELKMAVVQLLDSGNAEQIKAGSRLVVQFSKSKGLMPQPGQPFQPGAAAGAPAVALDKYGFQTELRKLDPNARNFVELRNELFRRRELGRQLGR